ALGLLFLLEHPLRRICPTRMNQRVISIRPADKPAETGRSRQEKRRQPKGRQVDPQALEQVRTLLANQPRRRDLLIEHLHRIQDHYGMLSRLHLAALAHEMRLAQAEVYEVASFYHHFEITDDDVATPDEPARTVVRVCQSLSCEM